MRVLWVCNIILPVVAEHLGLAGSNKEGWLSGLCSVILLRQRENQIDLHVAFPVDREMDGYEEEIATRAGRLHCYGFYEDVKHPERYDAELETRLGRIMDRVAPDVVHCFGTEYPHTLAACRAFPRKDRILIGIQGLCTVYANAYFADLPGKVIRSETLRDVLKKDSIVRQRDKFVRRGMMEMEAISLAGNITGRTAWDRYYTDRWNPRANYYAMNETLRENFYEGRWEEGACIPRSIFLSQGDYPIKGLHYLLLALPAIQARYPQTRVYVAGNSIVKQGTLKDRLKISAYGKYLLGLIRREGMEDSVVFLGPLNAEEMKERYLRSHLFVCCSAIENSPNSLGEAMLLGMPCVSADVGGIPSIFRGGEDGILYEGFRSADNPFDNICDSNISEEEKLERNAGRLANAVIEMWENEEKRERYGANARNHAKKTHDREANYQRMTEIYAKIMEGKGE